MTDRSDPRIANGISRVKVEWYNTIFLLVGSVLAAVDPVTDILTLREFYLRITRFELAWGLRSSLYRVSSCRLLP